jgi:hypothetical protein
MGTRDSVLSLLSKTHEKGDCTMRNGVVCYQNKDGN